MVPPPEVGRMTNHLSVPRSSDVAHPCETRDPARETADVARRAARHDRTMTAVIELDHLTKRYGAARGIEDLSLSVERGEVFGFLGPERCRQDDHDPDAAGPAAPDERHARVFGLDSRRDRPAIHAASGQSARRLRLRSAPHGPRPAEDSSLSCVVSATSGAPARSRSASRPISSGRSESSHVATARRSGSCRPRSTTPSC